MMQPRNLPLTTTPGLAPRVASPAYSGLWSGEVRPCIISAGLLKGGSSFGTRKVGFGIEGRPGLHRFTGRIGRDGTDTTRYQRGCSGVVYAMV
jgi:hypothetical protein